ncbi:MAG: BTAD domain-containing putative transcriptional regulator [Pseudomonadota bacterium]
MRGNGPVIDSRPAEVDNPVHESNSMNKATVRILGPLELRIDAGRVELGGGRQRALLAILALHANEVVSSDRLIDELWGEHPPSTAHKALQNAVSQLRAAIGPDAVGLLVTQSPGYVLRLDEDALDSHRFEQLADEGRRLLEEDPARAAEVLREALGLWRGEPLVDFAYDGFARPEILRLEELRLAALEDRIDADLALGRHAELIAELEPLVAAHALRERLRGQLMLALYRGGRQTEALETYRAGRSALHKDLGLEPSAGLKQLERAILEQDESLGPPPRLPRAPLRPRRRRVLLAVVSGVLVVAASLAAALLLRDGPPGITVVPDSLVKIDPATGEIVGVVPVGKNPGPLAVVGRYVFVASPDEGALYRVDTVSGEVTTSGRYDASGFGIAGEGDTRLWIASAGQPRVSRPNVTRVEADSLESFDRIPLPSYAQPFGIAVGGGSLWVAERSIAPAVSRWSLRTLQLERRYELRDDSDPFVVGFGAGAAWITDPARDGLLRIDARSKRMRRIPVGRAPVSSVVAFGSVWVHMFSDCTVWRIAADTGKPQAIIPVPAFPEGIAAGAGSVWVTGHTSGVVSRIDPATNSIVDTIKTGYYPWVPAVAGGFVWVGLAGDSLSEAKC